MVRVVVLFFLVLVPSLVSGQWRNTEWQEMTTEDLHRYVEWIQGTFSSKAQSQEQPYFGHVEITQTLIYSHQEKYWIHIRQGNYNEPPYRERVYKVYLLNDTTIVSKTYQINGIYQVLEPDSLDFTELRYMEGCDSYIHKGLYQNFYGNIREGTCLGSFAGADYTTSSFMVYENMIVSLEQGWTFEQEQRWGPSRGYYYFRRIQK